MIVDAFLVTNSRPTWFRINKWHKNSLHTQWLASIVSMSFTCTVYFSNKKAGMLQKILLCFFHLEQQLSTSTKPPVLYLVLRSNRVKLPEKLNPIQTNLLHTPIVSWPTHRKYPPCSMYITPYISLRMTRVLLIMLLTLHSWPRVHSLTIFESNHTPFCIWTSSLPSGSQSTFGSPLIMSSLDSHWCLSIVVKLLWPHSFTPFL